MTLTYGHIYDTLYEILGFDKVEKLLNTTIPQIKMFLTCLSFASKMMITGDIIQIDLSTPEHSGIIHATKVLKNENAIFFLLF